MLNETPGIFVSDCLEENFTDMDFNADFNTPTNEIAGDDIWGGQILLVSDDPHLRALYTHAIELVRGRCAPLSLDSLADELPRRMNSAALIIQITEWNPAQEAALEQAERFCEASNLPLLIRTGLDLIDFTIAAVRYPRTDHLLGDNVAELLVTLEHGIGESASSLFADRDEVDLIDLKKISADVERIARALVKLSGPEQTDSGRALIGSPFHEPVTPPAPDPQLRDASLGYIAMSPLDDNYIGKPAEPEPASNPASTPASKASGDHLTDSLSRPVTAGEVRGLIKARRLRDQYFDAELFADPAWDMLLDLMAARLEGTQVAVSSLCIAASVPPTTALRWIKTMTEERIFLRRADEQDGRRIFIELSDDATAGMVGFFAMVRRSGLMLI